MLFNQTQFTLFFFEEVTYCIYLYLLNMRYISDLPEVRVFTKRVK